MMELRRNHNPDIVDTQTQPSPVPFSGDVFVNRYGMTLADSDEDLILKHLI